MIWSSCISYITYSLQSNECTSSPAAKLEGFKRAITSVTDMGVKVATIITDRQASINKYIRLQLGRDHMTEGVIHYYDAWHLAKGISFGKTWKLHIKMVLCFA